ncbi:MAG: ABC transporter substrate-binding protein [Candidatus Dormibacteria bacterium]
MRLTARSALPLGLAMTVVLVALAYVAYLGSTREVAARGGSVTEGLVVDGPLTLLPPFAGDTQNSRDISSLLYRGLTRTGADGRPEAELATRWEIDASSKVFTFHLRPGLHWSDGSALTSKDAVFTLSLLDSDAVAQTPTGQAWTGVKVDAPDPLTVVYTLPAPSAPFIALTAIGLVPEHALRTHALVALPGYTEAPTSGPFMVDHLDRRGALYLRRNPNANEKPALDGLTFRMYASEAAAVAAMKAGDVDVVAGLSSAGAAQLAGRGRELRSPKSFAYTQVLFNQKQAVLADGPVRRALALSVNRARLLSGPLHGYAGLDDSPIPPGIRWASSSADRLPYDRAAAARILDQAGWKLTGATRKKGETPLQLKLAYADMEPYSSIARQVADDMRAIGADIRTEAYPQVRLVGEILDGRKFDMVLTALDNGPDPDFYVFWHSSEEVTGGFNFSGMPRNVFLDKDLEDARFSSDQKVRHDSYDDAQKILRGLQPAIFLYNPDFVLAFSSRVHGVKLYPAIQSGQRFEFVQDWYVNFRRVKR